MKLTATYDKDGIAKLADDKPFVYRIQNQTGKDNFVGSAKQGRIDRVMEHLGVVPGHTVKIQRYDSIQDAKSAEQRIINRGDPKWNRRRAGR